MHELTLPPKEFSLRPGICDECYGPLSDTCMTAGCHERCKGCGHEVWEHDPDSCLHCDFVGDYGEYNDYCVCVLSITNLPYGTHSSEHYPIVVQPLPGSVTK